MELNKVYLGNAIDIIRTFPDESIDCVVTSPPYYGLRDYGTGHWEGGDPNCKHYRESKKSDKTITGHKRMQEHEAPVGDAIYKSVCPLCGAVRVDEQIGLEETPEEYIDRLVELFREIKRCLKKEGTIWVNIGDSYWGGGWRNAEFNEHSGEIQKGSKGTYCGKSMPNLKGYVNGYKPKDLIGIPWMLAFALRAAGWYLRQDIIWHKPNPMPESVTDRCTKAHEYIFLLSKSKDYYFAYEEIQEDAVTAENRPIGIVRERELDYNTKRRNNPEAYLQTPRTKNCQYDGQAPNSMHIRREMGMKDVQYTTRNKRDVWSVCVKPNRETHFATYPESLVVPCIKAGCPENGVVLDPFMGSGTTGIVARKLNRNFVGTELNPEYQKMAERRIFNEGENLFNL